ncbi:unnamed protein product [Lymnaea stagnalis]|uniref:Uncharacterized protein n=1 Tax=Lymnaea stagnalis TaxID=6523 RepID=A0AAV2GZ35_LYMST
MEGVTHTTDRRDLEITTTPTMVTPNHTSTTLNDEITNATAGLTGLGVQTTGGYVSLVYRLDLCQKMSPPPIPPWLMETPDKLRHLVANCSSWKKYTDLCSLHIPPEYPQALADGSNSGSLVVQWIPFIIVLLIVTFIVVSVVVMYTLYRSNRMKCDIFSDYQKHENFPHNYCLPHGSLTSSVTIETQLSVCALEDDSFASMPPLHLVYEDIAQSHRTQTAPPQSAAEIILHPAALEDAEIQSHQFVSDRSIGDYYSSSHSLPIIPDKGTPQYQHQQTNGSVGSDNEDSYVLIHKRKLDTSSLAGSSHYLTVVNENKTALSKGKDTVRGMVKRCRQAGVHLVHGVFGNKANEGVGSTSGKPVTSLNKKLRRSFHSFQLQKQRPFRKSKSLEHEIISSDISATVEPDTGLGLEVGHVHSLTDSNSKTGDHEFEKSDHKVRTARRMLKIINPLQRSESKGAKRLVRKEISTRQSAGDEPHSSLKSNRSQFKGIKMTNIFKKFNKGKAS